jgi:hypothetical protein
MTKKTKGKCDEASLSAKAFPQSKKFRLEVSREGE